MIQEQAFEAVRQANPLPSASVGPDGFLSMTALLDRIDERSTDVQTKERHKIELRGPSDQRPRRLIPALVGGLAVIVAIVVGALLLNGGGNEPDVIEPPVLPTTLPQAVALIPLEVTNLYNEAVAAGDWTALRALYADTAELEVVSPTGERIVPTVPLVDYVPQTPYDWDGDGLVDGFDGLIDDGARQYAAGTTTFVSCSQVDELTAACQEVWEGFAFARPDINLPTWTLTIVDGVITTHVLEVAPGPARIDTDLTSQYNMWVSENRPELEGELFEDIITLAVSPDIVGTHRELVAEWMAQR